jgi:hypothetical protein
MPVCTNKVIVTRSSTGAVVTCGERKPIKLVRLLPHEEILDSTIHKYASGQETQQCPQGTSTLSLVSSQGAHGESEIAHLTSGFRNRIVFYLIRNQT